MTAVAELLTEHAVIQDTFVSGLSHVEDLGEGTRRFVFYSRQASTYGGDEFVIVARIVMTETALMAALATTMKHCGYACCGAGRMKDRH